MREILFRGKRTDNGEWAEGYYACESNHACFAYELKYHHYIFKDVFLDWNLGGLEKYEVIPETVGQYTGFTDKNGKKIFEGDIITELDGGMDGIPRKVVWREAYMQYGCPLVRRHWAYGNNDCGLWMMQSENIEVIGNIHDNPELLKGATSDA